jgi:hypothetical protein
MEIGSVMLHTKISSGKVFLRTGGNTCRIQPKAMEGIWTGRRALVFDDSGKRKDETPAVRRCTLAQPALQYDTGGCLVIRLYLF